MNQLTDEKLKDNSSFVKVDFSMVTFTLAGKDYGIDIMKVKEISKASTFTFVPNAPPFVKGVYNLRGDIISVIDLRVFFNLQVLDNTNTESENMIILRLQDHTIAVIVDSIDNVVGISTANVQPPHPLFGDINIKYINGIAENNGHLYVILDVERIFGTGEAAEAEVSAESGTGRRPPSAQAPVPGAGNAAAAPGKTAEESPEEELDLTFIEETLVTFASFYPSPVNQEWIRNRFSSWKAKRGENVQLANKEDAEAFLSSFYSPFTGTFWNNDFADKIASFINKDSKGNFFVWNPGCANGYETYSAACMIKKYFPAVNLKIIAHDNDLIKISMAPGLAVSKPGEGLIYEGFLAESTGGYQFKKEIKDSILFEYHDVTHNYSLPKLDMVVMRDTVSFLPSDKQKYIFQVLDEYLKPGGLLILGANEKPLEPERWETVENAGVTAYKKK